MTRREELKVIVFVLVVAMAVMFIGRLTFIAWARAEAPPKPVDRFRVECETVGDFATRHMICSAYDYRTGRTWLYVRTSAGVATLGEVTEAGHAR